MEEKEEIIKGLHQKCKITMQEIKRLEKEPKLLGRIYSFIVALLVIIFIIICIFSVKNEMCIIAISTGIIAWIGVFAPYYIYKNVKVRKEIENTAKIYELQDMICDMQKEIKKIHQKRMDNSV